MYYYRFKDGKCTASSNYPFEVEPDEVMLESEVKYDISVIKLERGEIVEI